MNPVTVLARPAPIWTAAVRSGLAAARSQVRPLFALQVIVALVVVGAFLWPAVSVFLTRASRILASQGLPGVFVAAGFASGILAEGAVVAMH